MFEAILGVLISILKAQLYALILFGVTVIIEQLTPLEIFVGQFKWKKSTRNAEMNLNRDSGYYFIFCGLVFGYDIYKGRVEFGVITAVLWLAIMLTLAKIFRRYYRKYQAIDPNKADDDYT